MKEDTEVDVAEIVVADDHAWHHLPVKCHPDVPVHQRGVGWCSDMYFFLVVSKMNSSTREKITPKRSKYSQHEYKTLHCVVGRE